jgi:hypothetical protein
MPESVRGNDQASLHYLRCQADLPFVIKRDLSCAIKRQANDSAHIWTKADAAFDGMSRKRCIHFGPRYGQARRHRHAHTP